ncbi:Phage P2 tail fiber gpH-like protein [Azotobacter vinelandii CA]|uniref:Phage P2 tail fiber gpH-like protein n=2 Tax=Azotobacter vinelandii TaxID=354 RepID=C1DS14_AZOVD|nr:phage tail protein [Azotobacter vinelandii]ACO79889.1 Phage P2 tail fiber gpH-like protein [Azotobacter vinelandii DJ]AGK13579.1 Phage P2 tail fiber gpH-like protein [Azotobacter vinelandii CA]AGK18055.1 Phage P2 tail fiber gpH-like protein [Azotobacter vinelandii CA6]SFX44526.1 Phage tail-collar fibre protein [Azotobacter vinelandii]GLK62301.1 hypothetical protein GCM10017624_44650 [Azotobacter vinelandii]
MSDPQDYYVLVTQTGLALEGASHGNQQPLRLAEMAVGDGLDAAAIADGALYYAEYDPDGSETALRHERWRGPLTKIEQHPTNPSWWIAEVAIPDEVGGWYVSEAALYTEDGELYAIAKYPPSLKPLWTSGAGRQIYVRLIFQVTQVAEVTVVVDPAVVYVSRGYVDDALAALELRTLTAPATGQPGQVPVRAAEPGSGNPIAWVAPGAIAGAALRKDAGFTAAVGARYYLADSIVVTLPQGSGLQAGDSIAFVKSIGAAPLIQAQVGDNIRHGEQIDSAVTFDIQSEIIFVWSGTTWEV